MSSDAAILDALPMAALRLRYQRERADYSPFASYRFNPAAYIRDKLGWEPWSGSDDQPGQQQALDAYTLALRQQFERNAYESGEVSRDELTCWQPGQTIKNHIRIASGHAIGKTKLSSGIVNHFFDCFTPSIIYTFAPSWPQIHDLLWKEIKADRRDKGLPGIINDIELRRADNHFAKGRATNNSGGRGTERIQGQHEQHLLFVLDEAEGVAEYVWQAIRSMTSGGIVIVLMLANPHTRTSEFHRQASRPNVQSFRVSCLWHPNVLADREVIPGAVRRDYVESMLVEHCEVVTAHDADAYTFAVPWRPGVIYKPDPEMLFRVLGIAPANISDNALIPLGRFEAACARTPESESPSIARMGVDVARYGKDYGTLYVRHDGCVWRAGHFYHQDTVEYTQAIVAAAKELAGNGVTSLHIRVDGGGGFGGGVIDQVSRNLDLAGLFPDFAVFEVHFNGTPYDVSAYADLITEMQATAGDALQRLAILDPPAELEPDLCERTYRWMTRGSVAVKRLEPKEDFRHRQNRSPDDGDGFVLAVAPDYLFIPQSDEYLLWDEPAHISPF